MHGRRIRGPPNNQENERGRTRRTRYRDRDTAIIAIGEKKSRPHLLSLPLINTGEFPHIRHARHARMDTE